MQASNRVGFGMDSHKFTKKPKKLILGGVEIVGEQGLEANSDGDVLYHALFNGISQAIGERSLGFYADEMCENGVSDSGEYLKVILNVMRKKGYQIGNVGLMIEAKKPRILDCEEQIKKNIADLCQISIDQIGVTATTGEGLTSFGKGLGIQCFSIVNLVKD